jgi:tetratricopeptide (TPR) repeat protein
MTFKYLRPALSAGLVFFLLASLANASTPEQIFVEASPSVVVVDILDAKGKPIGRGSGTVIGTGLVITNCHLAQSGKSLQVRQSGKTFNATLQYADPDRDLCQLTVPDLQAPPVALGIANKLRIGQRVYAIGAPQGLELTLSEGLISSLRPYDGSQYIQTSAAISPGSSGGGLFDDQGQLIGIITFYLAEGQNLNFALPVDWIADLPKRVQTETKAKKDGLNQFNRAATLLLKEDWQGLLKFSQLWIKSEPERAVAWYSMGSAYNGLKQYDQAIRAYHEVIRIQPEQSNVWYSLGNAYAKLRQFGQAIQAYQEALRIQPEDGEVWNKLGVAYRGSSTANNNSAQYDLAIQAFKEAVRIQPEQAEAWSNLALYYSGIKQYDQAVNAYREVLRIHPENAGAWFELGITYQLQGQRDKVLEVYQNLRKLDPAKADTYFDVLILPNPKHPN